MSQEEFQKRFEEEQRQLKIFDWAKESGLLTGYLDPAAGTAQLIQKVLPSGWPKADLDPAIKRREEEYQARRQREGEEGIDWARMGGNVMSPATLGTMAAPVTTAPRMIGYGAAMGASQPVTSDDYLQTKALQTGIGAVTGLIPAAPKMIEPFTKKGVRKGAEKFLREQAGDARDQIVQSLSKGGKGTAGQVLSREAGPGEVGRQFIKLEKELSREPLTGGRLKAIYNKQKTARENIIDQIAETDLDMSLAREARQSITEPMYKAVEESTKNVDVAPVVSRIDQLINKSKLNPEITKPLQQIKDSLTDDVSPQSLSSLSEYIKLMMGKTQDGKNIYNVKVLDEVKGLLDKQIGTAEKSYAAAQETYKALSTPINRMQVGRELANALTNSLEKTKAATFATAVENAPRTIKRATGFPRFKKLEQVLTKDQVDNVQMVAKELVENAKMSDIASGTNSVLKELEAEFSLSLPHILSRPIVIANAALKLLNRDLTPRYKQILTEIMEDPKKLESALQLPSTNERAKVAMDLVKEASIAVTAQPTAREMQ